MTNLTTKQTDKTVSACIHGFNIIKCKYGCTTRELERLILEHKTTPTHSPTETVKITRAFARANHLTFSIPPIKELLDRYVTDSSKWADPFARDSKVAYWTNDIDTNTSAMYHLEALEFSNKIEGNLDGVLFDPPYSYRQISDHYKSIGLKASGLDTSYNFYRRVQLPLSEKIRVGGYAICFGWNTNGFGKKLGFELVEVLIVAHGMHHNDTLVTVERKL